MDIEGFDGTNLELKVYVYNINDGMNADIVNACEELRGYVYFVSRVRHYTEQEKADTNTAVRAAIQDCVKGNLLTDFFANLSMEDTLMLAAEWDLETAIKVEREEAFEEGEKNMQKKMQKELLGLIDQGCSVDKIRQILLAKG